MSAYGIECSRCGGTILPGDGHALQHERADVAALVKAATSMDKAIQAYCKHPGVVETNALFTAHRGIQAALKPFEGIKS